MMLDIIAGISWNSIGIYLLSFFYLPCALCANIILHIFYKNKRTMSLLFEQHNNYFCCFFFFFLFLHKTGICYILSNDLFLCKKYYIFINSNNYTYFFQKIYIQRMRKWLSIIMSVRVLTKWRACKDCMWNSSLSGPGGH